MRLTPPSVKYLLAAAFLVAILLTATSTASACAYADAYCWDPSSETWEKSVVQPVSVTVYFYAWEYGFPPQAMREWNYGDGTGWHTGGQSGSCTYTTAGQKTATYRVNGQTSATSTCAVTAFMIRCVQITATYDVDIYWPELQGTSDVIWSAKLDKFHQDGTIEDDVTRMAIADVFRPTTQTYTLTFTLDRYPDCTTSITPNTDISLGGNSVNVSGWTPSRSFDDATTILHRAYYCTLTFKSGNTQVGDTQTFPMLEDFAIYDTYKCAQIDFTYDHLSQSCNSGSGKSDLTADSAASIPRGVQLDMFSHGFAWVHLPSPWDLLTQNGDCMTHADLMQAELQVLGVSAGTTQVYPPSPVTRTNCGISEHYADRSDEVKFFKYDGWTGGTSLEGVCSVTTSDLGLQYYDLLGTKAYGTMAQMGDPDADSTEEDFAHDIVNDEINWRYWVAGEPGQWSSCSVP